MPTIHLSTPPDFRFWPTAVSHGWCELPPYQVDETARVLERLYRLPSGRVVRLILRDAEFQPGQLTVRVEGIQRLTESQANDIRAALRRCLELDRDLGPFYAALLDHPRHVWIERIGAGRMLASPTVWEDLVKTLLTTNTVWKMTIQMTRRLVTLGDPCAEGGHAFPTPERIAALDPAELDAHVRAGYRSAYLHLLASRIASGELDVESWRDPDLPSLELYRRVKSLKGFGDYAAGNMLRLLGHFDRLATDSVCREVYRDQINHGQPATSDREIADYYAHFGQWQGLVQWMDVMHTYYTGLAL